MVVAAVKIPLGEPGLVPERKEESMRLRLCLLCKPPTCYPRRNNCGFRYIKCEVSAVAEQSELPCCVDPETRLVDKEKGAFYWAKIREAREQLEALRARPARSRAVTAADAHRVRKWLAELPRSWGQGPIRGWQPC